MKKYLPLILFFAFIGLIIKSCSGPSPCECSEEFYYSAKYPLATDGDKISDCMKLYYEENKLAPKENYGEDYYSAYYYFGNHPCHD